MDVKKAPKKVLDTRIKFNLPNINMKVGTALALTALTYLVVNDGDARSAGADMASDIRNDVAPIAVGVAGETIDFAEGAVDGATNGEGIDIAVPVIDINSGGSESNSASGVILNLAGFVCTTGNYSLADGPWGALESANFEGSIADVIADNPQIIEAAQNGAQTIQINC